VIDSGDRFDDLGTSDDRALDTVALVVPLDRGHDPGGDGAARAVTLLADLVSGLVLREGGTPLVNHKVGVLIAVEVDEEEAVVPLVFETLDPSQDPFSAFAFRANPLGLGILPLPLLDLGSVGFLALDRVLGDLGEIRGETAVLFAREAEVPAKVFEEILGRVDRPESVPTLFVLGDLPEIFDDRDKGLVLKHRLPQMGVADRVLNMEFLEVVSTLEIEPLGAGLPENGIVAVLVGENVPLGESGPAMGAMENGEAGLFELLHDVTGDGVNRKGTRAGIDHIPVERSRIGVLLRVPVPRESVLMDGGFCRRHDYTIQKPPTIVKGFSAQFANFFG